MVGYGKDMKGYRIFFPKKNVIEIHCDVKFMEKSSEISDNQPIVGEEYVDFELSVTKSIKNKVDINTSSESEST